jgi:uncharacterized protein YbjQ (UPF0145 family)
MSATIVQEPKESTMWKCVKCHEQVEDSFDVCWNCGASRDGTEDPSFQRVEDDRETPRRAAAEEGAITAKPRRAPKAAPPLIVTTGNEVAGHAIASYLGVVRGIVVRSPGIVQGFLGGLQTIVGGNIETYAEVCEAAREEAYQRMIQHAHEKDADALIGMRYDATEFAQGVTEVLAYATAVKLARR